MSDPKSASPSTPPTGESPVPDPGDRVDVTLIRWMLSLTPAERLKVLRSNIRALQKLRQAAGER